MTDGDESFHLTPLDVRRYEFGRSFRGYDPERVEQFRTQVAEELERLSRANQELDTRARGLQEQLRAFRERDKAINDALVSAQQLRAEIRDQAERESQLLLREAQVQGDQELELARSEVRRMEETIQQLERTRRGYLAQIRILCERQLAEVAAAEMQPSPTMTLSVTMESTELFDSATLRRDIERDFGGQG